MAHSPHRSDHPVNALVRALPLSRLSTTKHMTNYIIRMKRDHTFLKNLFHTSLPVHDIIQELGSAKFSIGLLPWLDRCMLFRRTQTTKLMILGIDYKHFPVFYAHKNDQNFPLTSYRISNNIWGPSWKNFWTKLLGIPYDDKAVNAFLTREGVYMINSMLCFGGSASPTTHSFEYIACCRQHIIDQLTIVRPDILVSFGNAGCRNAASILLEHNPKNRLVQRLAESSSPIKLMSSLLAEQDLHQGIRVAYHSRPLIFWPLYQPARIHLHRYTHDYDILQQLVGTKKVLDGYIGQCDVHD